MSILIDSRRELAEQHISDLAQRRKEIAGMLQRVCTAMAAVKERPATFADVAAVLPTTRRHNAVAAKVANMLLPKGDDMAQLVAIKTDAIPECLVFAPEAQELIDAAEVATFASTDPMLYWQGGKFVPIEVTDDEKENIYKRAEIRAATEGDAILYKEVEKICSLANLRNAQDVTQIRIKELTTGANIIYAGLLYLAPKGPHLLDKAQFRVNRSAFNCIEHKYQAFDEGPVKMN